MLQSSRSSSNSADSRDKGLSSRAVRATAPQFVQYKYITVPNSMSYNSRIMHSFIFFPLYCNMEIAVLNVCVIELRLFITERANEQRNPLKLKH